MSKTNVRAAICDSCKTLIAARCGTVRYWNGAARRYAPTYAKRSAFGVLSACHCQKCERA